MWYCLVYCSKNIGYVINYPYLCYYWGRSASIFLVVCFSVVLFTCCLFIFLLFCMVIFSAADTGKDTSEDITTRNLSGKNWQPILISTFYVIWIFFALVLNRPYHLLFTSIFYPSQCLSCGIISWQLTPSLVCDQIVDLVLSNWTWYLSNEPKSFSSFSTVNVKLYRQ